jgi:hypothetical protein
MGDFGRKTKKKGDSCESPFCVATKKLIETPEGVHLALLGGAGQKKGVQLVD